MKALLMNEKEYRKAEGLNYSALAQFGVSQDHCLMEVKAKSYFEHGHMFEMLLQDTCTDSSTFEEKYFVCDVQGTMPDNLISLIKSGADLSTQIVYTKSGDRNKTHATKHAYIDACIESPGRLPVGTNDMDMLNRMVDNALRCELLGEKMHNILSNCEWQVALFWEKDGLKKKALVDCVYDIGDSLIAIDIKTTANLSKFYNMARTKYYIQDIHYSEGLDTIYNLPVDFYFFAASKDEPYLCRPFKLKYWEQKKEHYKDLCSAYNNWKNAGKPEKGWLELESIDIF